MTAVRMVRLPPPMPRIIYRYLLLEILPPFGVGLLGFTSIVFLGRMMRLTQMIVVKGVGLVEVLKSCVYLLPYLLVFTLPMAATVGVLLAMTRLSVDHEMIAMKTAGMSYTQFLPPILAFSLATTVLTLGLTVFASPWGQQATRDLLKEVVKHRADLGIREQAFNTDFQGLMLFVNRVSAQGALEGVFINDYRDEENPNTIYAQRGQLSYDQAQGIMILNLRDGRVIRWERDPRRWQAVEFKTYELPLQLFGFGLKGEKSESEMSLRELWDSLGRHPKGQELYNRAMVELNQRFAMPLGALLLCLMAMPLGLSPRHHGRAWGLILGLVIFLVYYVVFTASWRLAVNARVNPSLAPWIPNFLFIWVALYLWYRTVRELPLIPAAWPAWPRLFLAERLGRLWEMANLTQLRQWWESAGREARPVKKRRAPWEPALRARELWARLSQGLKPRAQRLWEELAAYWPRLRAQTPRVWWGLGVVGLMVLLLLVFYKIPRRPPTPPRPAGPAPMGAGSPPTTARGHAPPQKAAPSKPPAPAPPAEAKGPTRPDRYLVLVATYFKREPARALTRRLQKKNIKAQVVQKTRKGKTRYQVQVGPVTGTEPAEDLARRVKDAEKLTPMLQKLSPPASARRGAKKKGS